MWHKHTQLMSHSQYLWSSIRAANIQKGKIIIRQLVSVNTGWILRAGWMQHQDGCAASLPALHSNPMGLGVGAGRRDRGRHEVGHAKMRPCRAWTVARPPIWQRAVQPTVSAMGTNETGQGSWLRFSLGMFSCLSTVFTQVEMMLHKCLCFFWVNSVSLIEFNICFSDSDIALVNIF